MKYFTIFQVTFFALVFLCETQGIESINTLLGENHYSQNEELFKGFLPGEKGSTCREDYIHFLQRKNSSLWAQKSKFF